MSWNIIQHYLFVYHSQCLLYILIYTVNVTGCTVLTLCDGQLAAPASNCTLCGYFFRYHSALFVNYIQSLLYSFIPTFTVNQLNSIHNNNQSATVLYVCSFSLIFSPVQASVHRTYCIHLSIIKI